MPLSERPLARNNSFGPMQADWEIRIDFDKMRRDRLEKTKKAMDEADVDYLLLFRTENTRYTASVRWMYWPTVRIGGIPIVAVPRDDELAVWAKDVDHITKSLSWLPKGRVKEGQPEVDLYDDLDDFIEDLNKTFGPNFKRAKIGVDIWSPAMYEVLPKKFPNAKFVDGQKVMLSARKTKTPEEIACLKMGYAMSEAGMQAALDIFKPGVREGELLGACFNKFGQMGSEVSQCSEVINSGPGTWPYRRHLSDRIIQAGELVNMDFGACFAGYFGDYSRTFVCGRHPSKRQLEIMREAYDLQMAAADAVKPGVAPADLCKKLRRNSLGHGIGIAAFEWPHLRKKDKFEIEAGMIFCLTALTHNETGGSHLEDQVIVTNKGCEIFSTFPYAGVDE